MLHLCPCSTWDSSHWMPSFPSWLHLPTHCSFPSPPAPLQAAVLGLQLLWGYPWAAAFKPHPLLHCRLLCGCTGRSALHSARGLQPAPLLGCREILLCAWSSSCPLALILVPAELLLSQNCCCTAVFFSSNLLSQEHAQHRSWLSKTNSCICSGFSLNVHCIFYAYTDDKTSSLNTDIHPLQQRPCIFISQTRKMQGCFFAKRVIGQILWLVHSSLTSGPSLESYTSS